MTKNSATTSFKVALCVTLFVIGANAADFNSKVERPDAKKILKKDALKPPKKYDMPKDCVSSDPKVIAIGQYIFHNLNGKKAKKKPPEGLAKFVEKNGKKKPKQYGNCVACHNIEGAVGAGNIGPDLHAYKKNFIDTKVRDAHYVYQQIADSRINNKDSRMTINLTTGLLNEKEVCALTSYILSEKK
jgi:sulfur-oxidizing protein SoxX